MAPLQFFVPGLPIAQPAAKQRTNVAGGAYRYVPQEKPIHAWRAMVAIECARVRAARPLITGPVWIFAELAFPRGNAKLRKTPDLWEYHTKKPDGKNLLAGLEDALKQVAWDDDCRNALIIVLKRYVIGNEVPGTYVKIQEIHGKPNIRVTFEEDDSF